MAFRIRDLMINVIPDRIAGEGGGAGGDTTDPNCDGAFSCDATCGDSCAFDFGGSGFWQCGWTPPVNPCGPTYPCIASIPCGATPLPCLYNTCGLSSGPGCYTPRSAYWVNHEAKFFATAAQLAALKVQLRTTLAEVEAREAAAEAAQRPRTREQAEALEEKLKGAIAEVRDWKKTLPSAESE